MSEDEDAETRREKTQTYARTRTFTYDGRGLPPKCIRSGRLRRTLTSMRMAMRHASAPGRRWEAHSTCG